MGILSLKTRPESGYFWDKSGMLIRFSIPVPWFSSKPHTPHSAHDTCWYLYNTGVYNKSKINHVTHANHNSDEQKSIYNVTNQSNSITV